MLLSAKCRSAFFAGQAFALWAYVIDISCTALDYGLSNAKGITMKSLLVILLVILSSCVVVPTKQTFQETRCEISSDKKTLRVFNVAKETNSYYSLGGLMATPILIPTTAILSGTYVAVNNIYHYGQEQIVCR